MNYTPRYYPEEFNRFLFTEIDLKEYRYKFLNDFVENAKKRQVLIYDLSLINTTTNGWIIIIHSEMLLVYGYNWNIEQLDEINEIFDLNEYTNYTLSGDDGLIDALISFYKPKNFEIEKRRLFYQSNKIKIFNNDNLTIRLGSQNEMSELAIMLQDYYHEEYNGLNDKKIEEMENRIFELVLAGKIYVLLDTNNILVSFCTIIDPDIGILYTKRKYRNKGYGKIILSYCSNLLLKENDTVYLMTDRDKIESNLVCEKVGFIKCFEYNRTKINCG